MFIIDAAPITKIPLPDSQIFSYFFREKIAPGSIISVPLFKRKSFAVVLAYVPIAERKINLKSNAFQLKSVIEINSKNALRPHQLVLAQQLSEYYFEPLGLFLKLMLPNSKYYSKIIVSSKKLIAQTLQIMPSLNQLPNVKGLRESNKITEISSRVTPKKFFAAWSEIRNNQAGNIVGTRQSIFSPITPKAAIIIENEESPNYKSSEQAPRYNTKRIAQLLKKNSQCNVTLKSSSPSIESAFLSDNNQLNLEINPKLKLKKNIQIIDNKEEIKNKNYSLLSNTLSNAIIKNHAEKKNTILFINRRGSGNAIWCQDCANVIKCMNCTTALILHNDNNNELICHHCGHRENPPSICPECQSHKLRIVGGGTQKVKDQLSSLLPADRILILDSDNAVSATSQREIIEKFNSDFGQILVATQMIFNHDINDVNLIGVISADSLLHFPDYKSGEKTWQIINKLCQMTNKDILIQTNFPEHYLIKAIVNYDFKNFYLAEIATRKLLSWPPFSQLIKLSYRNSNEKQAHSNADILLKRIIELRDRLLIKESDFILLGPAPAFIAKLKGYYQYNIIIKNKLTDIKVRNNILSNIPKGWDIDIDPESIL
ncbi:MAG: primosomal protein N' [Candidatus Portnoybacteria bacterium CG10_big_fil_rev_8_21_14_0_10_36_7]|uniref:Primosomal protein N n=1 Tax=Candidatus Portnoybacteria bacterium CG10_big_fil_rev_8_21_14_0_10_36_7 TaxID=1974812 RepID=A0A2M8KEM3_9BACT|nr:MAG: primosomal protein N' [Candidatus Portnoybacteria bacterium CG10_big_fil_rev_8_21_14_0_10_36_7]